MANEINDDEKLLSRKKLLNKRMLQNIKESPTSRKTAGRKERSPVKGRAFKSSNS